MRHGRRHRGTAGDRDHRLVCGRTSVALSARAAGHRGADHPAHTEYGHTGLVPSQRRGVSRPAHTSGSSAPSCRCILAPDTWTVHHDSHLLEQSEHDVSDDTQLDRRRREATHAAGTGERLRRSRHRGLNGHGCSQWWREVVEAREKPAITRGDIRGIRLARLQREGDDRPSGSACCPPGRSVQPLATVRQGQTRYALSYTWTNWITRL